MSQPQPVFDGMTHERLSEVFDLVKPLGNWKMPISTTVFKTAVGGVTAEEISSAVVFFTGGFPDVVDEGESFWVQAPGYYMSVGA